MDALELRARREALGLDQATLAGLLHWDLVAVLDYETGEQDIPTLVDAKLDELELARDTIAGILEDTLPADLPTYATDTAFWSAWPDLRGIPATIHRVAAADALRSARWAGIHARIVPAEPDTAGQQPATSL
jgi:transcriptional regulator with XRE-family HTH domain